MALYTRYRPKDWDSVVGQEYITTILRNALDQNRVGHAYLFHGSRGTGKTTSARILAKAVNCLDLQRGNPCHSCTHCRAFDQDLMMDVIEIDAASNTGVDNIRDLIEKARFEPNQGKYKIYIIDEVHMLSTGAFNALLKTLEDPPSHVKFILATTEVDKVLETIRSRTQRFDFQKITDEVIQDRLRYVCKQEEISVEEKALTLIARVARGGMRDALTLLEQNIQDQGVSFDAVRASLMLLDEDRLHSTLTALVSSDRTTLLGEIETLRKIHIQARPYFEQMLFFLRDELFRAIDSVKYRPIEQIMEIFFGAYGRLRSTPDGLLLIEMTLLKAFHVVGGYQGSTMKSQERKQDDETRGVEKTKEIPTPPLPEKLEDKEVKEEVSPPPSHRDHEAPQTETMSRDESRNYPANTKFSFPMLLDSLKQKKPALSAQLKLARFQLPEDVVVLFFFSSSFNRDQFEKNTSNKMLVLESLSETFGGEWRVEYHTEDSRESRESHHLHSAMDDVF